jgi:acyl-CoA synthetase (AMP-forming)/AMP-acid ligase II
VHITGRSKDVIIRSGENISADEIEAILGEHPLVAEAAVIGVPDERTGERVCAVIVLIGPSIDLPELVAHCTERGLGA